MIEKILRALAGSASQPDTEEALPSWEARASSDDWTSGRFNNPMTYHWRCACGAHSRGGDIKADAEYSAQRHMLSKPMGHPMPEVYSAEEE